MSGSNGFKVLLDSYFDLLKEYKHTFCGLSFFEMDPISIESLTGNLPTHRNPCLKILFNSRKKYWKQGPI